MLAARISILGAGAVGTAIAFSLAIQPLVNEVLLIDSREELRDAQIEDLRDASLPGVHVRAGTLFEARDSALMEYFTSRKLKLDFSAIAVEVKDKAGLMIRAKGSTSFGVGALTSSLCKTILLDEEEIRSVSHWSEELGCCLGLPVVLGRNGVKRESKMSIDAEESVAIQHSASILRNLIARNIRYESSKQEEIRVIINELTSDTAINV